MANISLGSDAMPSCDLQPLSHAIFARSESEVQQALTEDPRSIDDSIRELGNVLHVASDWPEVRDLSNLGKEADRSTRLGLLVEAANPQMLADPDSSGLTPFLRAVQYGDPTCVRLLLDQTYPLLTRQSVLHGLAWVDPCPRADIVSMFIDALEVRQAICAKLRCRHWAPGIFKDYSLRTRDYRIPMRESAGHYCVTKELEFRRNWQLTNSPKTGPFTHVAGRMCATRSCCNVFEMLASGC